MATLNTSYRKIAESYCGSGGGTNVYIRLYAKLNSQSITNNNSSINLQTRVYFSGNLTTSAVKCTTDGTSVTVASGSVSYKKGTEYTLQTVTRTIGHASNGTSGTITKSCSWSSYYSSVNGGTSGSFTLPTIARQANLTSAPNFNDEQNPTINYSNSAGNSVSSLSACISLTGAKDDIKYRDISKTGSSYTFNLTDEEKDVLRNACKNSNTLSVKFYVRTVLGGNTYYSILDRTMSIVNGNPTFTDFEYSTDLQEMTGNNETVVNGMTKITFTITPSNKAVANKGASILRYSFVCGSQSVLANYSDDKITVTLQNCTTNIIKITAIDSRGFETTVTKTIPYFRTYFAPSFISMSAERESGVEETTYLNMRLTFWNYSFGVKNNSIKSIKYRFKETGSSSDWSEWYLINTNKLTINKEEATLTDISIYLDGLSQGFTIGKAYDLQLSVSDGYDDYILNTIESNVFYLSDGKVAFSILRDNDGEYHIGLNGMPDLDYTLKVHGNIS